MAYFSRRFVVVVLSAVALICGLVVTSVPAGATVKTATVIPSPSPSSTENPLNSVSCVSSDWCVAVGYEKSAGKPQLFILMYDGTSWTQATAPNVAANWDAAYSVSCVSTSFCVAVGFSTLSPVTHVISWDGTSWTTVESPNVPGVDNSLFGVSCLSATYCVAVGLTRESSGSYLTHNMAMVWDGIAWGLETPSDIGAGSNALSSVSCVSPTYCVAVGIYDNAGTQATLSMVWDGATWTAATTPSIGAGPNSLEDVSCVSTTYCIAVGTFDDGGTSQPLAIIWDGSSWTALTSPDVGDGYTTLYGISCVTTTFCTAVGISTVGNDSPPLIVLWDGSSWSWLSGQVAISSGAFTSVSCDSLTTCMAVGQFNMPSQSLTAALTEGSVTPTTTTAGADPVAPAFTG